MNHQEKLERCVSSRRHSTIVLSDNDLSRSDERDDSIFYEIERPGPHLDRKALETVEAVIGALVVEEEPVILDLMAGVDSHLPDSIRAASVVGLGLNESELKRNGRLTSYRLHDLNRAPRLPFKEGTFDLVVNTVSVDYMVDPFTVFEEISRILKPGGLLLVIFSNRYFPTKAIKIWKEGSDEERLLLVEDYFSATPGLEKAKVFVSRGKPRPEGDKYSGLGLPSDPIYAVYAERSGRPKGRKKRPDPADTIDRPLVSEGLAQRTERVGQTLRCPHCEQALDKWKVPDHPFSEWNNDFMYICFNDCCSYYVGGWSAMARQGNHGVSYRYMYNPENGASTPIPVPSPGALKSGIIDRSPEAGRNYP